MVSGLQSGQRSEVMVLEKTKALYTEASNSLSAFLQMNEVESEEEVEDELRMDGKWFAIRSKV